MTKPKQIFVTGASGYIAKHIVLQLLDAGYHVRGSVRSDAKAEAVRAAMKAHAAEPDTLDDRLSLVKLDLTADEGWAEALAGVDVLMHTASPFPATQPKNEDDLIRPAVDGTLRALNAAKNAGVTRVVLTSSMVAVMSVDPENAPLVFDESHWSDPSARSTTPYYKSKTLAERAAWDFVAENPDIKLTTINPGLVLGPALDQDFGTSLGIIERALSGKDPMVPKLGIITVDVRDVARMHVNALTTPEAEGRRFIASAGFLWFKTISEVLRKTAPGRKVPHRIAPNWIMRVLGLFDKQIAEIIPQLGKTTNVDNAAARDVLGIEFISLEKSVADSARFLLDQEVT